MVVGAGLRLYYELPHSSWRSLLPAQSRLFAASTRRNRSRSCFSPEALGAGCYSMQQRRPGSLVSDGCRRTVGFRRRSQHKAHRINKDASWLCVCVCRGGGHVLTCSCGRSIESIGAASAERHRKKWICARVHCLGRCKKGLRYSAGNIACAGDVGVVREQGFRAACRAC